MNRPVDVRDILFGDQWDYSPAPQSADFADFEEQYGHYIGGEFVEADDYFQSINPATEEPIAEFGIGTEATVDRAVEAAREGYEEHWKPMPASERAKYIYRIGRMIKEKSREIAVLESMDGGKPIRESRDVDIPLAAAHFFHYAGWADKLEYSFPGAEPHSLGVCGQVIPWNFPLLMAAWKIAPALATGNTVVIKPAETTPLTAMKLAEIIDEAGFPPGVVNIVNGAGTTGSAVVEHDDVDKVAFTGSTEVGKVIQRAVAGTDKRLTLELGGKGSNIIFDDAAVDQAVEGIINGIYFNQGHVCCAGSRLLVQENIHDEVIHKLKQRMETLRIGDPLDKNTDIGAINSKQQLEKIDRLVDAGVQEGCELHQASCETPDTGYFFKPTFFTDVTPSHRVAQEEIFGPVLSVMTFRTPDEAVRKANNTPYGLACGVWTDKGSKLFRVAGELDCGVVWGNTYNKFDPGAPFGGYKESGFGREGGRQGLLAYLELEE
ncbi:MAG: aldehyde dehydrogenase family protein [Bradymonadaceae bacterium]